MTNLEWIAGFLINAVWQSAIVAILAWIILRVAFRTGAAARHALWLLALCASVALPIATTHMHALYDSQGVALTWHWFPSTGSSPAKHTAAPPGAEPAAAQTPRISLPGWGATAIASLWLLFVALFLTRLFWDAVLSSRLRRNALPLEPHMRAGLCAWSARRAGLREVRLCVSGAIDVPMAVGFMDAMIVLPERLVQTLEPADLDRIVMHELAHLRRADDWTQMIERCAAALFFFCPAILWMLRQLDVEREVACDEIAAHEREREAYAASLVKMARSLRWPCRRLPAPGVFSARATLSVRVERLLNARLADSPLKTAGAAGALTAALATAFLLARAFTPALAYASSDINVRANRHVPEVPWVRTRLWHLVQGLENGSVTASDLGETQMQKGDDRSVRFISAVVRQLGPAHCEQYLGAQAAGRAVEYRYKICFSHSSAYYGISVAPDRHVKDFSFTFSQ